MNQTVNLHLPQFAESDRIHHDDFNDAFSKIDTTLGPLSAAAGTFGNCAVYTTQYTGRGSATAHEYTFPAKPLVVMVGRCDDVKTLILIRGATRACCIEDNTFSHPFTVTWNGNTVRWYQSAVSEGMNWNGSTYTIVALLDKSAE